MWCFFYFFLTHIVEVLFSLTVWVVVLLWEHSGCDAQVLSRWFPKPAVRLGWPAFVAGHHQEEQLWPYFHLFCLPAWVLSLLHGGPGQGLWFLQKRFWSCSPSGSSCLIPGTGVKPCWGTRRGGRTSTAFLKAASFVGCSCAVGLRQRMWFYAKHSVAYRGGIGSKE